MTTVETGFDLERYLTNGVEDIVRSLLKTAVLHPKEASFVAKYAASSRKATALRRDWEAKGVHIPSFLIASITNRCNLHCAGCYARSLELCDDAPSATLLSAEEWGRVFGEARELGIGFILLAGGEPMARTDVLEAAGAFPEIIFPIFTNGTLMTDRTFALLDKYRNLIPVFSVEGGQELTDGRRGAGTYGKVTDAMRRLQKSGMVFGASVTVTTENQRETMSDAFTSRLWEKGCKVVIYVEYVPTDDVSSPLAPDDVCRAEMAASVEALRRRDGMLYLSFPGDEAASSGCLAAGRGFFHINPCGGAEPCPFSPYSDTDIRDVSLLEALDSGLFRALRSGELLQKTHTGGCVLYENREKVEALLSHGSI